MNLLEYILANRGDTGFFDKSVDDIKMLLIYHTNNDTIVTHFNGKDIDGVLLWNIEKYIPLTVNIVECISTGRTSLVDMLTDFVKDMPPNFICIAKRNRASKDIQYKNPRRILKLLKNYVS